VVSTRLHELAFGGDHVDGDQVVDREPVLPHQEADPTAQREPGQPGVRNEPSRDAEPKGLRLAIELTQEDARLGADRPGLGVDPDALHRTEIDHDSSVAYRVPGVAVPAAPDRDEETVRPREADRPDDVGDTRATGDERRAAVDRCVPYPAMLVVGLVPGPDHFAAENGGERFGRAGVERDRWDRRNVQGGHGAKYLSREGRTSGT
jgi:hypothetical protein